MMSRSSNKSDDDLCGFRVACVQCEPVHGTQRFLHFWEKKREFLLGELLSTY